MSRPPSTPLCSSSSRNAARSPHHHHRHSRDPICPLCDDSVPHSDWRTHVERAHVRFKPFRCGDCSHRYYTWQELQDHCQRNEHRLEHGRAVSQLAESLIAEICQQVMNEVSGVSRSPSRAVASTTARSSPVDDEDQGVGSSVARNSTSSSRTRGQSTGLRRSPPPRTPMKRPREPERSDRSKSIEPSVHPVTKRPLTYAALKTAPSTDPPSSSARSRRQSLQTQPSSSTRRPQQERARSRSKSTTRVKSPALSGASTSSRQPSTVAMVMRNSVGEQLNCAICKATVGADYVSRRTHAAAIHCTASEDEPDYVSLLEPWVQRAFPGFSCSDLECALSDCRSDTRYRYSSVSGRTGHVERAHMHHYLKCPMTPCGFSTEILSDLNKHMKDAHNAKKDRLTDSQLRVYECQRRAYDLERRNILARAFPFPLQTGSSNPNEAIVAPSDTTSSRVSVPSVLRPIIATGLVATNRNRQSRSRTRSAADMSSSSESASSSDEDEEKEDEDEVVVLDPPRQEQSKKMTNRVPMRQELEILRRHKQQQMQALQQQQRPTTSHQEQKREEIVRVQIDGSDDNDDDDEDEENDEDGGAAARAEEDVKV